MKWSHSAASPYSTSAEGEILRNSRYHPREPRLQRRSWWQCVPDVAATADAKTRLMPLYADLRGSEQQPLGNILMAPLTASEPSQACDCPRVPEVRALIVTDPDCSQEACFGCGHVPDCGAFECLPFRRCSSASNQRSPVSPTLANALSNKSMASSARRAACTTQPSHQGSMAP